jgi:hypothetical protein
MMVDGGAGSSSQRAACPMPPLAFCAAGGERVRGGSELIDPGGARVATRAHPMLPLDSGCGARWLGRVSLLRQRQHRANVGLQLVTGGERAGGGGEVIITDCNLQ